MIPLPFALSIMLGFDLARRHHNRTVCLNSLEIAPNCTFVYDGTSCRSPKPKEES